MSLPEPYYKDEQATIRLSPDAKLRKQWFVGEAMSHPAKGHLGLWWEILERYTQPGQTVLDPMAGIGSSLIGCLMGRNVVCNEMETHFIEPMLASWRKMQLQGPMLGHQIGEALIIQGDARCLPLASADCVVTSPPWEDKMGMGDTEWFLRHKPMMGKYAQNTNHHEEHLRQGYTRPSAIVSSPPYEGTGVIDANATPLNGPIGNKSREAEGRKGGSEPSISLPTGYTRPSAIVTSPLYEDAQQTRDDDYVGRHTTGGRLATHHVGVENIGNLRGDRYWAAMNLVYTECHRVLIPGGVMALVVKGYTRNKQYVDLPQQTADLIETLGFQVFDRWTREVPLSFWRTLQKQKGNWDEALRFEHVIAARKELW